MTPSTTEGMPIMALRNTVRLVRPGKRATATQAPRGRPSRVPRATAERLTSRDRPTTASTWASKPPSREKASRRVGSMEADYGPGRCAKGFPPLEKGGQGGFKGELG